MAVRYVDDEERKRARREFIVASDHFGVLEGLRGRHDEVLSLVDTLKDDGFVMEVERTWDGGGYRYPAPSERGGRGWKRGGCLGEYE